MPIKLVVHFGVEIVGRDDQHVAAGGVGKLDCEPGATRVADAQLVSVKGRTPGVGIVSGLAGHRKCYGQVVEDWAGINLYDEAEQEGEEMGE